MWGDTSPRSGGSSSQEVVCTEIMKYLYKSIKLALVQEILRNGFDKLDPHGVTHLDLAAHGTVSLSR